MKFSIAVNMERFDSTHNMRDIAAHARDMVVMADEAGFETAWVAEHHTIEMTIAPGPFQMLMHWAEKAKRIRLGTAVIVAPYWHPIRLAGEAALFDLLSDGRLELGIARGAYQYEIDRMAGIDGPEGVGYMKELVPAVKALWQGDYEHDGQYWQFPTSTSVPKPVQQPHPPIWIAARDPGTFDWAMKIGANIQTTPLQRPMSEVGILAQKFEDAVAANPQVPRPRMMMMRRTFVYDDPDQWEVPVHSILEFSRRFENLFKNAGGVVNGFPEPVDLEAFKGRADGEYEPRRLWQNLSFGTPEEVIEKLKVYEAAGVDQYCYYAPTAVEPARARRSLELFIQDVMPHFSQ